MNLFDLVATLSLDTSQYEKELEGAGGKAQKFAQGAGKAVKVASAVVAGVATAVTGLGVAFTKNATEVAQYGDNIDKMSQKIGISAESYQKWDYVMKRAGTSVDSLKMGMKTLSQQAEKNASEFQKLGISEEEVASLSQEELFEKTIKGLSEMESGTERATMATKLLGRAGVDLAPLLNEGSDAIEEQMELAEKYGMVMPESAVKASAGFNDSITTMQMTLQGLKNRLMGEFLPSLTEVTDGLALIFTGDIKGADKVVDGINGVIDGIKQKIPAIMEMGGKIVSGLASAIAKSAPLIFSEGAKLVTNLVSKLVTSLPEIVSVGTDIITSVIDGITESIPDLIEQAPQIILSLVTSLATNLPKIIESGGKIILAIVQGLIKAIPQLIKAVPTIINSFINGIIGMKNAVIKSGGDIIKALGDGISKAWNWFKSIVSNFASKIPSYIKSAIAGIASIGSNIVTGIWNGISNKVQWLKSMISGWVGNVKDFLKSLFGISSPSKWARDIIGGNIVKGLALGLENGEDLIQKSFNALMPDYDGNYTVNVDRPASANGVSIVNYITVDGADNPEDFTDRFVRRLRMDMRTV